MLDGIVATSARIKCNVIVVITQRALHTHTQSRNYNVPTYTKRTTSILQITFSPVSRFVRISARKLIENFANTMASLRKVAWKTSTKYHSYDGLHQYYIHQPTSRCCWMFVYVMCGDCILVCRCVLCRSRHPQQHLQLIEQSKLEQRCTRPKSSNIASQIMGARKPVYMARWPGNYDELSVRRSSLVPGHPIKIMVHGESKKNILAFNYQQFERRPFSVVPTLSVDPDDP